MRWSPVPLVAIATLSMVAAAGARADAPGDDSAKMAAVAKAPAEVARAATSDDVDQTRPAVAGGAVEGVAEVAQAQALPAQAPAAMGTRPLKLPTTVDGLDAKVRRAELANDEGWRNGTGGTAPSPIDVRNMPTPGGEGASGGPAPVVSARDRGGVVGFSYKINPR